MNAEINIYPVVENGRTGQKHFSQANSSFLANVACRSKDVAVRSFILEYPKLWHNELNLIKLSTRSSI